MEKQYFNATEAAKILGINKMRFSRIARRPGCPFSFMIGRHKVYSMQDVNVIRDMYLPKW